jgi:phosphoglycerate kinase
MIKILKDANIKGKTILYRAPYDIEAENINGSLKIKDTSRIDATIPTLNYLIANDCKIVILTWVGRPKNGPTPELSTVPHTKYLQSVVNTNVSHINDCIGDAVIHKISTLKPKEILMLENVRFHKEEDSENADFARQLCNGCEFIVFDGFPQAHRKAPSTTGILEILPACAGFYFESEYILLNKLLTQPKKPFTLVIGGAKTSDKVEAINNLYDLADIILVGGGAANAFLKAQGKEMGNSYIEEGDSVKTAQQTLNRDPANENFKNFKVEMEVELKKIMLPYDLVLGMNKEDNMSELTVVENQPRPVSADMGAMDIGPITRLSYAEIILQSGTVFWAGPMGVYENKIFEGGTKAIAQAMATTTADTIIAGGDTIDALNKLGDPKKIKFISLAGGATLEFIAGKKLPVIEMLTKI